MNTKKYIYVANWKMNMSFNKARSFCTKNKNQLTELAQKPTNQIILCPEYPALHPLANILNDTDVQIGAQNCSEFNEGAYTGQVSTQTLQQAGCTHCIVGHSESRTQGESDTIIAQKVLRVLEHNMHPIICFGESKQEHESKQSQKIIEQQLTPVIQKIKKSQLDEAHLYLAYEPIWSIGTGLIPDNAYLTDIFTWITAWANTQLPKAKISYLYGGSVKPDNVSKLKEITQIDGFLIGGASLDFQNLEKIVLW